MTNEEIIQAIRTEIERRKEEAYNSILPDEPKYRTHYKVGKKELCEELLSFLDTLESEKPIEQEGLEKEMNRYFNAWQNVQCEEDCSNEGGFCCVLNGDLKPVSLFHCRKIARHFYDLGCRRTAEKFDEIEYNKQRAEESVCGELEKENIDVDVLDNEFYRYLKIHGLSIQKGERITYYNGDAPNLLFDLKSIVCHFYNFGCFRTAEKYNEIEYNRQRAEENEKPSVKDAMKELNEKIALVKERGTWDGVDVDKYMDEVRGREPENPMNQDGLEDEMDRFFETMPVLEHENIFEDTFKNIARHFAQWGAEHSGSSEIPNDLEEAARHSEILTYPMPEDGDIEKVFKVQEARVFHEIGFIAGAKWQADHTPLPEDTVLFNKGVEEGKRLMMEEAVEGNVCVNVKGYTYVRTHMLAGHQIPDSDKVRVFILPKED